MSDLNASIPAASYSMTIADFMKWRRMYFAENHAAGPKRGRKKRTSNEALANMARTMTPSEIAQERGVSRQAVYSALKRYQLIDAAAVARAERRKEKAAKSAEKRVAREAAYRARHGMTLSEIRGLSDLPISSKDHPFYVFRMFANNCKRPGTDVEMKFSEWWALWQESGHYEESGRGLSGYGVVRRDKKKPFNLENCYIAKSGCAQLGLHRKTGRMTTQEARA